MMVPVEGIEPPTFGLQNRCSTAELNRPRRYTERAFSLAARTGRGQGWPARSSIAVSSNQAKVPSNNCSLGWRMRILRTMAAATAVLILAAGPAWCAPKAATLTLVAAAPDAAGFSPERLKRLDAYMQGLVDQGHLPGAITMVARHGKIVSYEAFGKKAIDGAPMTKDTIFRIYSQTKPVTGVAMMILFEEGKWRLDDPVTKFVPEFAHLQVYKGQNPDGTFITEPATRVPTMREIMSHTGGFAYGLRTDQPVEKAYRDSGLLGSK